MPKITIGKKEFEVKEEFLNQSELFFYEDNPRVYSILRSNGEAPSQQEIEEKMTSMDHVKQLKLSIEQNGGLIDPLIVVVRNDNYVVLEGNSRLAAYRLLAQRDPLKWQKVRAQILPDIISDGEIFILLGQYHLIGRKDWNVFEQAAYLYRQQESTGVEPDTLSKMVGLSKSKVKKCIEVYKFMLDHNDLKPDRWSYYDEYLKSRSLKKYRETSPVMDDIFVNQVKSGEIRAAIDVRDKLSVIAKATDRTSRRIMQEFIAQETDLYDGYERFVATGKSTDVYKQIKKFSDIISDQDKQRTILLEASSNPDVTFKLKQIKKEIDKILSSSRS